MADIKVQQRHSRNGRDWTVEKDANGRWGFSAKGKGVEYRMGVLATFLNKNGPSTREEMLAHLQKKSDTYTDNDLGQPLKQLQKAGVAEPTGKGRNSSWVLSAKGMYHFRNTVFVKV